MSALRERVRIVDKSESGLRERLQLVEDSESSLADLANTRLDALTSARRELADAGCRIEHLGRVNARIDFALSRSLRRTN